jgi:HNH endonuclease
MSEMFPSWRLRNTPYHPSNYQGVASMTTTSVPRLRPCLICQTLFRPRALRSKYCSRACVEKAQQALSPETLFWRHVQKTETCWLWTGHLVEGYGSLTARIAGKNTHYLAHRLSYEMHHGVIPSGLTIDHLCRVRRCVNPAHLEAISMAANILRGYCPAALNKRKVTCKFGHAFTDANTHIRPSGRRECRLCKRLRTQRIRAQKQG